MKILVTGGAGFMGCNFVKYMLKKHPDLGIVVLDKLTYAGRLENLEDVLGVEFSKMSKEERNKIIDNPITNGNLTFIKGDICDKDAVEKAVQGCDWIVNYAAETHVDRSIENADAFVKTDILGTLVLLDVAKKHRVKFLHIGTDEVYGQIKKGKFTEETPLNPRNPYAASKAGADMLIMSYFVTHQLPVIITRSCNYIGPNQFPEKVNPVTIINIIQDKKIPVYGKGLQVREWIYTEDHCSAIDFLMQNGKFGEIYNISGGFEINNIDRTRMILKIMGKSEDLIEFVKDRPGHDFRYALDISKIKALGWRSKWKFEDALKATVEWYVENGWWWKPLVE